MIAMSSRELRLSRLAAVAMPALPPPTITMSKVLAAAGTKGAGEVVWVVIGMLLSRPARWRSVVIVSRTCAPPCPLALRR